MSGNILCGAFVSCFSQASKHDYELRILSEFGEIISENEISSVAGKGIEVDPYTKVKPLSLSLCFSDYVSVSLSLLFFFF
jgi:hypothetical protein